jgi:hypothetical protein
MTFLSGDLEAEGGGGGGAKSKYPKESEAQRRDAPVLHTTPPPPNTSKLIVLAPCIASVSKCTCGSCKSDASYFESIARNPSHGGSEREKGRGRRFKDGRTRSQRLQEESGRLHLRVRLEHPPARRALESASPDAASEGHRIRLRQSPRRKRARERTRAAIQRWTHPKPAPPRRVRTTSGRLEHPPARRALESASPDAASEGHRIRLRQRHASG